MRFPTLALCMAFVFVVTPRLPAEEPKTLTNSIGMKLVLIPAGDFQMGAPAGEEPAESDERP